jgi:hypothetical protein
MEDSEFEGLLAKLRAATTSNTWEAAVTYASILQASQAEDRPGLHDLEAAWSLLTNFYGSDEDGNPDIDRATAGKPTSTPIEMFDYYVDVGIYPPPEIMLCIADCFRKYFSAEGKLSLDECFFGSAHKMRESLSYVKSQYYRYMLFQVEVQYHREQCLSTGESPRSLETLAEDHLSSPFGATHSTDDVDTFLRGYRRWRKYVNRATPP